MVIGSRSSWQHPLRFAAGGDEGNRTLDPLLAGQVLSQLSYTPMYAFAFGFVEETILKN